MINLGRDRQTSSRRSFPPPPPPPIESFATNFISPIFLSKSASAGRRWLYIWASYKSYSRHINSLSANLILFLPFSLLLFLPNKSQLHPELSLIDTHSNSMAPSLRLFLYGGLLRYLNVLCLSCFYYFNVICIVTKFTISEPVNTLFYPNTTSNIQACV